MAIIAITIACPHIGKRSAAESRARQLGELSSTGGSEGGGVAILGRWFDPTGPYTANARARVSS